MKNNPDILKRLNSDLLPQSHKQADSAKKITLQNATDLHHMTDFIKVAELDDLDEGELIAVEVDGEPVCLAKVDGTVYAFTGTCTHIGGPLNEGELEGVVLTCPWHAAQYDIRTGKVLRGPARQDIQIYPVRVEGDSILVSLPDEI